MVSRRRILVVDDEPTVRESCERIFGERGFDVETAATGKEGLERTRSGYFDCALIDLKMPDLNGMDLVRQTREHRDHMAVLIVTGYGSVDTAAEATRLGVSDYVTKPFSPDEIVKAVERALEGPPRNGVSIAVDRLAREIKDSAPKPEQFEHRTPPAVTAMVTKAIGVMKAKMPVLNVVVLGILAGVYIGFGAQMATLVGVDAAKFLGVGVTQLLCGAVFSVGLMLVVIAGAELFTGNNLMVASVLEKQYGWSKMAERWALVFLANLVGSVLLAYIMYQSGLWKGGATANAIGERAVRIAATKTGLPWGEAFFRGIGCNWLVCLAVWMALSSKDIAGKILAIFFPIMAFVALGYEHCVANMYFIPMGLFLKGTAAGAGAAALGISLDGLSWARFLTANLVPVTLGNIVGGGLFVGSLYWFVYMRGATKKA